MTTSTIELWFTNYKEPVYGYLTHFVGVDEADDLLQETFISALRGIHTFRGDADPKTWLFAIARNAAIDFLRKKKKPDIHTSPLTERESNIQSTELSPEDSAELHELRSKLTGCIGCLKDSYREVITLRGILNLSISETSEITGWNQTKVRVTYHRALKALHQEYTANGLGGVSQWATK